jgi:S1-C subfamily serine protease
MRRSVGRPEREGVLVRGVEDGSPAAAAGIQGGDLIVEIGGTAITTPDDLVEALAAVEFPVEVKLVRGNDERTVQVGGGTTAAGEA